MAHENSSALLLSLHSIVSLILDWLSDDARHPSKRAASIAAFHHFIESCAGNLCIACLRSNAVLVSL